VKTANDHAVIHWELHGDEGGETVVMLHSLGSDGSMWAPQVAALAGTRPVITMDIRGHGRSSAPPGPYALEDLTSDVLAVANDAGLDRFHVVGLSMGGQMALWLAAHAPERIISMTAANTGAKIGTDASWAARIDAVRSMDMPALRPGVIERWFSPDFAEREPEWFASACSTFDHTSSVGYIGCCAALAGADLRASVPTISAPSLIVGSDLDVSTPPHQARWIAENIRGAQLEIIEGAGHLSNLDRHGVFDAALSEFLEST
jgi:3-oxoadipate enol-lactonase